MGRNVKEQRIKIFHIFHPAVPIRMVNRSVCFKKIQPIFLRNILDSAFSLTDKIPKFILCLCLRTSKREANDGNSIITFSSLPFLLGWLVRGKGECKGRLLEPDGWATDPRSLAYICVYGEPLFDVVYQCIYISALKEDTRGET